MVLDTAAKAVDVVSQGTAAFGKWTGWYDMGFTCLSSTCRNYEACIKGDERPEDCKSEALKAALEEATVIIPIYRQGRECLAGDEKACGGIAALALGLVKGGGKAQPGVELEPALIRSAIERPRAGDPNFAKVFEPFEKAGKRHERSAAAKGTAEPLARPRAEEPAAGRKTEPAAKAAPREAAIDGFAEARGISPKQLKADLAELRRNARDPGKVRQPADPRFDAELSTSANGEPHTFDREKVTPGHEGEPRTWCRSSPAPACGVPVPAEVDKMVDEALKETEGGTSTRPPPRSEKKLTAAEYSKVKAEAEAAFVYGDQPGQIGAEVGRHKEAPAIREGEGVSGKQVQSAHVTPSSFMRTLDDYLRDNAITMQWG
jgi:hypothetical protein